METIIIEIKVDGKTIAIRTVKGYAAAEQELAKLSYQIKAMQN